MEIIMDMDQLSKYGSTKGLSRNPYPIRVLDPRHIVRLSHEPGHHVHYIFYKVLSIDSFAALRFVSHRA